MSIFKKAQSQDDMDIFAPFIRWHDPLRKDSYGWDAKILSDDMIRKYSKYFDSDAWHYFYQTANPVIEIPKQFQDEIDEYFKKYPYEKSRRRKEMERQIEEKNTMNPEISQNTSDFKDNLQGE